MKKIFVLSKNNFDNFCLKNEITDSTVDEFYEICFISIHNTNDNWKYAFSENHSNVLNLTFDDIEEDVAQKNAYAFTSLQASELYEFILSNSDKSIFVIHCTAGISRSGAIGTFIANYFNVDMEEFKMDNPYILPNSHVLKMLNFILWENHFNEKKILINKI
jgi:predicted protein tyrosine phosphatase